MKPVLFLAAAMALAAGPAAAQDAPPAPPADSGTQPNFLSFMNDPFRLEADRPVARCFSGRTIVAATRVGERTVYVQPKRSPIYRMELAEDCAALAAAEKLSVRSAGYRVCQDDKAVLVVQTAGGSRQCKASKVHQLSRTEVASIAASRR